MATAYWRSLMLLGVSFALVSAARGGPQTGDDSSQSSPELKKIPAGVILVKGAWSSASDSVTPVPEGGKILGAGVYRNDYFGLTYPLPRDWAETYSGPPPSDSGYYVLAQIGPAAGSPASRKGSVLIAAQDEFFALTPAGSALERVNYTSNHLSADYSVERPPTEVRIASHTFVRFDYVSPVAELHWHVLATEIRCHVVEFVFTSRDTALLENLIRQMNAIQFLDDADLALGTSGADAPVCIKNYARDENILEKEDPVFTERAFNPVPVRIVIDRNGKVEHIHFLSAFPAQAKSITDALRQWRFKPYLRAGQPVEVETGILFGRPEGTAAAALGGAAKE